jgi:CRP-like cAMP-binding protein
MVLNALVKTGHYSDKDIALFEREVKLRQAEKDEVLLAPGEIAQSIFYVQKGAVYQYNATARENNIIDLHIQDDWCFNHKSFIAQMPSENTMAAFTRSDLLEISISSIHYLIGMSTAFLQLNRILEPATSRLYFFDHQLTPLQKYQYLFENKPQILQAFPLKAIASFLKIAPETLSRVREKFVKPNPFLDQDQVH